MQPDAAHVAASWAVPQPPRCHCSCYHWTDAFHFRVWWVVVSTFWILSSQRDRLCVLGNYRSLFPRSTKFCYINITNVHCCTLKNICIYMFMTVCVQPMFILFYLFIVFICPCGKVLGSLFRISSLSMSIFAIQGNLHQNFTQLDTYMKVIDIRVYAKHVPKVT